MITAILFKNVPRYLFYPGQLNPADRGLIEARGGHVEEGVSYDAPFSIYEWPPGQPRPEAVLARSRANPKEFKAFRFESQVPPDYEILGPNHALISSRIALVRLFPHLDQLDEIASITDASDTVEMWEEIQESRERRP